MTKKKWTRKEQGEFLAKLGDLMEKGYNLGDGIKLLSFHQRKEMKLSISQFIQKLREGLSLYEVLDEQGFPADALGYLYFSEKHGSLDFGLKESGKMVLKREELKSKFIKLIRYPLFLLILMVLLVSLLLHSLLPQFQALYKSLDIEFPAITVYFIGVMSYGPFYLLAFLVFVMAMFLYYIASFRHLEPQKQMLILLKFPVLKTYIPLFITQFFAVQLSCLLKGGLSIFEAITIFEKQSQLAFFKQESLQIKQELKRGESLNAVLENRPFFVPELAGVISHGQSGGQLSQELFHYSEWLFKRIEDKILRTFMILQPILFAFIGGIVLLMFASVLMPMFQLLNSL
jgi:competence protein ComGB